MGKLTFTIKSHDKESRARTGIIQVPHGAINTPAFMPVATKATVKMMSSEDMDELDAEILMANTYHLYLKPGPDIIKGFGGLHNFMGWNKPIITDSAGFQVFSLGFGIEHYKGKVIDFFPDDIEQVKTADKKNKLSHVTQEGVTFKSIYDGKEHFFTAEKSILIQEAIGSDIMIAFDECTSLFNDREYVEESLERTHAWLDRCIAAKKTKQALFGVVQGHVFEDLRKEAAKFVASRDVDGFCIGGSLGRSKAEMHMVLEWVMEELPEDKPVHLLGIGTVEDIFESVARGIDMFDCVGPARIARRGFAYILPASGGTAKNKFRIRLNRSSYQDDKGPIDSNCSCKVCQKYSRAYIRHLFNAREMLAYSLVTFHNLHFILRLMDNIRTSISDGTFSDMKKKWLT